MLRGEHFFQQILVHKVGCTLPLGARKSGEVSELSASVGFTPHMHCWICGDPAETGEHLIKVSDIRDIFGHITTHKPLFRKRGDERHELVQGARSKKLMFESPLCAACNNRRTQQHDKSWEALATFLRKRNPPLRPGETIRPARAFLTGCRPGMLGVHLYFAKHFGCLIGDGGAPVKVTRMRLRNRQVEQTGTADLLATLGAAATHLDRRGAQRVDRARACIYAT